VPFRDYTGFNAATLQSMTAAYDAAVEKLHLKSSDPLTGKLAATIAALASEGERDPGKLCERALAELHEKPKTPAWKPRQT
jgi:hypothetical protein